MGKVIYALEFKRTSDQGRDYREGGESRAMTVLGHVEARLGHVEAVLGHLEAQHDILIRSLKKVAEEAEVEKMMMSFICSCRNKK